jgi:hypothetical protein
MNASVPEIINSAVQERTLASLSPSVSDQEIYETDVTRSFQAKTKFLDDEPGLFTRQSQRMNGKTSSQRFRERELMSFYDDNSNARVPFLRNRHERRAWRARRQKTIAKAILLNKWEGMVQEVYEDRFRANLFDQDRPDVLETAEFSFNEISSEDRDLVREGAIFYWYLLYLDSEAGDRDRVSRIWFRRSGRMSSHNFSKAFERVSDVWRNLGWEKSANSSSQK